MDETIELLEQYFDIVKTILTSELLTEGEVFDILSRLQRKLNNNLAFLNDEEKLKGENVNFKNTVHNTIELMKKASEFYNTDFKDNNTNKVIYQVYRKDLLPKFTKVFELCDKYNKMHKFGEGEGIKTLSTLLKEMNKFPQQKMKFSVKTDYFEY